MKEPKLRFREFNEEFKKYKLENLVEVVDCQHSTAPIQSEKTIYKMIRTGNVRNGNLIVETMDFVDEATYKKWSVRGYLEPGDIILTREAPMGEVALVPTDSKFKFFLGQRCLQLKANKNIIDHIYMYLLLQSNTFEKYIRPLKFAGSTVSNIRIPELKSFEFLVPHINEQKKLSNLFVDLNKKIQLQQQKIELLQEQKKGYMQKIFKQELRFKGFSVEWKQRKLGDFFKKYQNTVYLEDDKEYIQVSVRNTGKIEYRGTKKGSDIGRKRQYVIDTESHPNTLTFTRQTIYEGGIGFVPKELNGAIVTENMPLLAMGLDLNKYFAITFFNTSAYYQNVIEKNMPIGSAQKALHEKVWLDSEIFVPLIEEQEKIGSFFKKIDELITLHTKKIDLLQEQKKGFMQQMFI